MKKIFLFILSLYIFPRIYAMEDEKLDINRAFRLAVGNANHNPSQEALDKIEECLKLGADINYRARFCEAAIIQAIQALNIDLFHFLVERRANINTIDDYQRTPIYILFDLKKYRSPDYFKFNIEEDFLKKGADCNIQYYGENVIHFAVKRGVSEAIKLLVEYGANINGKDKYKRTPLKWAMLKLTPNFTEIKELCDRGASLVDIDDKKSNAFHAAIQRQFSKEHLNSIVINSRLDVFNKELDEQLEKKVITAYLALEKTNIFPKDIQKIIVSYLALNYLHGFNKKFCQWLVKNGNKNPLLTYTLNKVNYLEQILQSTNIDNKTALQILHNEHQNNFHYIQEIEPLINVNKLQQDRNDFMNGSTREDNLVAQIYEHSKKLLFES